LRKYKHEIKIGRNDFQKIKNGIQKYLIEPNRNFNINEHVCIFEFDEQNKWTGESIIARVNCEPTPFAKNPEFVVIDIQLINDSN